MSWCWPWLLWRLAITVSAVVALPSVTTTTVDSEPSATMTATVTPASSESSAARAQSTGSSTPWTSPNDSSSPSQSQSPSAALLSTAIVTTTLMCILIIVVLWFARRYYKTRQSYIVSVQQHKHQPYRPSTPSHKPEVERQQLVAGPEDKSSIASTAASQKMLRPTEWSANTLAPVPKAVRGTVGRIDNSPGDQDVKKPYVVLTKDAPVITKPPPVDLQRAVDQSGTHELQEQQLSPVSSMGEVSLKYAQTAEIVGMRQSKIAPVLGDVTEVDCSKAVGRIKRPRPADAERVVRPRQDEGDASPDLEMKALAPFSFLGRDIATH